MSIISIVKGSKVSIGRPLNEWCKGLNADMVDNFHVSKTPTPNSILPLNENGILDLSTTYAKIDDYTIRKIDLTDATEDYELQVGEEAEIDFDDVTEVLLHIATFDGTFYELDLLPHNQGSTTGGIGAPVYLYPNNTVYSNAFKYAEIYRSENKFASSYTTFSAFRIGWVITCTKCYLTNRTLYKNVEGFYDTYGYPTSFPILVYFSTDWRDTTTPWTSLGTILFPQNTSGKILVKRLK